MAKKKLEVWVGDDVYQRLSEESQRTGETLAGVIRRIILNFIGRATIKEPKKVYELCSLCGKRHDENEHFPLSRHS